MIQSHLGCDMYKPLKKKNSNATTTLEKAFEHIGGKKKNAGGKHFLLFLLLPTNSFNSGECK